MIDTLIFRVPWGTPAFWVGVLVLIVILIKLAALERQRHRRKSK